MKKVRAVALCRVSTSEQLENNSLNRQRDAVLKAAELLGVEIPDAYWRAGSVSSKRGTNVNRKDLNELLAICKKDKSVKYVIVDEPDRFMRSIDEAAFFEVTFRELGVTVWYASDPELNKGDLASKLLKFTKYLSAEGSNEERQRKSINGQTKALLEGRYTFVPKPAYVRGYERGIPEIHPIRGRALQKVLKDIVYKRVTPTQGLIDLNKSEFMSDGHSLYKMDKFRKIVTDPFYAGVLEINKQIQVRNLNGLHERLITLEEHHELVRIMDAKKKNQKGPRKNGNPRYCVSNLVTCDQCEDKQYPRFVGFKHSNGSVNGPIYEKYRCRSCKRYLARDEMHREITRQFNENPLTDEGSEAVIEALKEVWKREEIESDQEKRRIESNISSLKQSIANQVDKLSDDKLISIHDEILKSIETKKEQVSKLEGQLFELQNVSENDKEEFMEFAYDFIDNMGSNFLDTELVSKENRIRCKQVVFPAGFYMNEDKKVYTPEISLLYRLATNKKDLPVTEKSLMVRVKRL